MTVPAEIMTVPEASQEHLEPALSVRLEWFLAASFSFASSIFVVETMDNNYSLMEDGCKVAVNPVSGGGGQGDTASAPHMRRIHP